MQDPTSHVSPAVALGGCLLIRLTADCRTVELPLFWTEATDGNESVLPAWWRAVPKAYLRAADELEVVPDHQSGALVSTAHEALACTNGFAELMLGGAGVTVAMIAAGDLLGLPAGTGHCRILVSDDFLLVGAYLDG